MTLLRRQPRLSLVAVVALGAALPMPLLTQQRDTTLHPSQYKQLADGVLSNSQPVFATDSLPGYRIEVRALVLGPNKSAPHVPLDGYAIMELRSGVIEVTTNGQLARRETSASWFVPKGARLAIRNLSELAVIRATVFTPR